MKKYLLVLGAAIAALVAFVSLPAHACSVTSSGAVVCGGATGGGGYIGPATGVCHTLKHYSVWYDVPWNGTNQSDVLNADLSVALANNQGACFDQVPIGDLNGNQAMTQFNVTGTPFNMLDTYLPANYQYNYIRCSPPVNRFTAQQDLIDLSPHFDTGMGWVTPHAGITIYSGVVTIINWQYGDVINAPVDVLQPNDLLRICSANVQAPCQTHRPSDNALVIALRQNHTFDHVIIFPDKTNSNFFLMPYDFSYQLSSVP
jgi:hypothetical protein